MQTPAPSEKLTQERTASPQLTSLVREAGLLLGERDLSACQKKVKEAALIDPYHFEVLHLMGLLAFERNKDVEKAHKLIQAALHKSPDNIFIKHNLSTVLIARGDFAAAEKLLLSVLDVRPDYTEAMHTLAGIRKFTRDDPILAHMEALAKSKRFDPNQASFLCFALGKAYDDLKAHDEAWRVIAQGNQLIERDYDQAYFEKGVDRIRAVYTTGFISERSQHGYPTRAPVFVVGMPRSGTTLLESVIADHPFVFAAGELSGMESIGRMMAGKLANGETYRGHADVLAAAPPEHIFAASKGYLDHARQRAEGWFEHFVDKMPDNSFNVGLAAAFFPQGQFVHIMRHPLDVILSIFFQRFSKLTYGFRAEHVAGHYKCYRDAMMHWREVLPDRLIEIRYENLIQDKDYARHRIHEHLGLPLPRPEMLSVKKNNSNVLTASRWQVRQPVYKTSKGKWEKYAEHLVPVIDALGGMECIENDVQIQNEFCLLASS